MAVSKMYLGDGVYVAFDGYGIVLTTENGIEVANTIVLEPEVLQAFELYVSRLRQERSVPDAPFSIDDDAFTQRRNEEKKREP